MNEDLLFRFNALHRQSFQMMRRVFKYIYDMLTGIPGTVAVVFVVAGCGWIGIDYVDDDTESDFDEFSLNTDAETDSLETDSDITTASDTVSYDTDTTIDTGSGMDDTDTIADTGSTDSGSDSVQDTGTISGDSDSASETNVRFIPVRQTHLLRI